MKEQYFDDYHFKKDNESPIQNEGRSFANYESPENILESEKVKKLLKEKMLMQAELLEASYLLQEKKDDFEKFELVPVDDGYINNLPREIEVLEDEIRMLNQELANISQEIDMIKNETTINSEKGRALLSEAIQKALNHN